MWVHHYTTYIHVHDHYTTHTHGDYYITHMHLYHYITNIIHKYIHHMITTSPATLYRQEFGSQGRDWKIHTKTYIKRPAAKHTAVSSTHNCPFYTTAVSLAPFFYIYIFKLQNWVQIVSKTQSCFTCVLKPGATLQLPELVLQFCFGTTEQSPTSLSILDIYMSLC